VPPGATVPPRNAASVVGPVNWIQNCGEIVLPPRFVHVTEMPEKPDSVVNVGRLLPDDWKVASIWTWAVTLIVVAVPVKPARLVAERPTVS